MTEKKHTYLTVDRVEDGIVIMTDEKESIYRAAAETIGLVPHDGDILRVLLDSEGTVLSAEIDTEATAARRDAMRTRLQRLFG